MEFTKDLDLQYLTNPAEMHRLVKPVTNGEKPLLEEVKDYRKRIFLQTKEYLRGESVNPSLDRAFHAYAMACVTHFKFSDKSELIQKDYKDYGNKKTRPSIGFDMQGSNRVIMKKTDVRPPRITDHINIKSNLIRPKPIIPKQRNYKKKDN
jgi:hypothetical protein